MSHVPLFPEEERNFSNAESLEEEKSEFKRPEYVLIDDRDGKSQYTQFDADAIPKSESLFEEKEQSAKGPLSLRFICLLGFIFCLIFGLGMFLSSIVSTCLSALSLFRNQGLNQSMRSFWKMFINTAIAGFGFTLGMISPTLGLGLLAIYFSLASNLAEDDLLRKVIRRSFSHF